MAELTDRQRRDSVRLKSLWEASKKRLGLTQASAATQLGMTQPSVNNYLNGTIALNNLAAYKFGLLLQVEPSTFKSDYNSPAEALMLTEDPSATVRQKLVPKLSIQQLIEIGAGKANFEDFKGEVPPKTECGPSSYIITAIGNENERMIFRGDDILVDPDQSIDPGKVGVYYLDGVVFIASNNGYGTSFLNSAAPPPPQGKAIELGRALMVMSKPL